MNLKKLYDRAMAEFFDRSALLKKLWSGSISAREGETPFTPTPTLSGAKLALLTTGGFHLKTEEAFDMSDPRGDPSFREIHFSRPTEDFQITHDYYKHEDAEADWNVIFPVERARELVQEGVLGALHGVGYSFMGHLLDDTHIPKMEENARLVAQRLKAAGVQVALLTPA